MRFDDIASKYAEPKKGKFDDILSKYQDKPEAEQEPEEQPEEDIAWWKPGGLFQYKPSNRLKELGDPTNIQSSSKDFIQRTLTPIIKATGDEIAKNIFVRNVVTSLKPVIGTANAVQNAVYYAGQTRDTLYPRERPHTIKPKFDSVWDALRSGYSGTKTVKTGETINSLLFGANAEQERRQRMQQTEVGRLALNVQDFIDDMAIGILLPAGTEIGRAHV